MRDWTVGTVLPYSSGTPIAAPGSNNNLASVLFQSTNFARAPGQPLFWKDLNCHSIDPRKDLVMNPAAWTDAAPGQFRSSAIYFNDYRTQRRPQESASAGRVFRIRKKMSLSIPDDLFRRVSWKRDVQQRGHAGHVDRWVRVHQYGEHSRASQDRNRGDSLYV